MAEMRMSDCKEVRLAEVDGVKCTGTEPPCLPLTHCGGVLQCLSAKGVVEGSGEFAYVIGWSGVSDSQRRHRA